MRRGAFAGALVLACCACATVPRSGPSQVPFRFERTHVVEVDIRLAPEAWDDLRSQHRCLFADFASDACAATHFPSPYTWKTATVTIDGETLARVAIRKKGFGSTYVTDRPGLKLELDKNVDGQRWRGMKRLTLNATNDPIRTCLAYDVLADAKLPAPRCAFAHVVVNGRDLGIYPVVESIDRRFLRRHFGDDSGALYEGQLNDFRADHRPIFERKRGPRGQPAIDRLTEALERDPSLGTLEKIVDLDAFFTFWAAEVLIARWDGYAGHLNNYFLYVHPDSGRIVFIPWGGNRATFERLKDPVLSGPDAPESVIAHGLLTRRLYADDRGRAKYVEALRRLLRTSWNEDDLLERIGRMESSLSRYAGERRSTEAMKTFVRERRAVLERQLADGPPAWTAELTASTCMIPAGSIEGRFSTTWTATTASDRDGEASLEVQLTEGALDVREPRAYAGPMTRFDVGVPIPPSSDGAASIVITAQLPTRRLALFLAVPRDQLRAGATIPLGPPNTGCPGSGPPYALLCLQGDLPCLQPAFIASGQLTFEATTTTGGTIAGRFRAKLIRHPWALFEGHPSLWTEGPPDRSWLERALRMPQSRDQLPR